VPLYIFFILKHKWARLAAAVISLAALGVGLFTRIF
jgi:hypothetical protein